MSDIVGFGAKFEYGNESAVYTSSTGWTEIGDVTDLKLPEPESADIKTTSHSTADGVHTYKAGLTEPGTSEVTCHYDKTVYATVKGLRGTDGRYRVRFSDGSGIGWNGYVKGDPAPEIDMEGLTTMVVKTKVSGDTVAITSIT
jgi:hypothetical protein